MTGVRGCSGLDPNTLGDIAPELNTGKTGCPVVQHPGMHGGAEPTIGVQLVADVCSGKNAHTIGAGTLRPMRPGMLGLYFRLRSSAWALRSRRSCPPPGRGLAGFYHCQAEAHGRMTLDARRPYLQVKDLAC
ncbi:hypothetical protein CORC01_06506 [Colletotrichum orchidophilum]|uniref:Uncharacterized protein n=1 Tax=Colletotrichum orchidophilum TaxID=1209926 RepID=A0A1G4B9R7_9PEZI|nr:uncharacterized protein CORC01_06506 [Colletotrichum orchidophilum]OHE98138.1 hypothetical protein CORC01_06506 [Colletotrichum orchidophilum]